MNLNNSWGRIFALATAGGFLLFDGCALKMGKQPRQEIVPLYSTHSPEFRQAAGSLLGPNFIPGNNITTLLTGIRFSRLCSAQFNRPSIQLTSRLTHFGTAKSR